MMPMVPSLVTTAVIVVSVLFLILSLCVFRWRAHRLLRQRIHADDWLISVTWLLTLGVSVNFWAFVNIIGINDIKGNPAKGTLNGLKCILIASCLLQFPLSTVKILILLFYKRIFLTSKFGYCIWFTIFLVSSWGILFFVLVLFEGDPIGTSWGEPGKFRFDSAKLGFAQVGTSIALDFTVLCLPIPIISRLHLQTKRKWAVFAIFWLGSFCCIAAIVRLVLLHQSIYQVVQSGSAVHVQSKNCVFTVLEANCLVIAACLPCYGPLFHDGWSQLSLIASVRSIFSLRSRGSNAFSRHYDGLGDDNQRILATGSKIQLKDAQAVEDKSQGHPTHGTSVTRAVEIARE